MQIPSKLRKVHPEDRRNMSPITTYVSYDPIANILTHPIRNQKLPKRPPPKGFTVPALLHTPRDSYVETYRPVAHNRPHNPVPLDRPHRELSY